LHQYSLDKLEYGKIKNMIAGEASTYPGKDKIKNLEPLTEKRVVERRLAEARQGAKIMREKGRPPLLCPRKLEAHLQRAKKELILSIEEINEVDNVLRSTEETEDFFRDLKERDDRVRDPEEELSRGPLQDYADQLMALPELRQEIDGVIDDNNEIKDSASPELARLRRKIAGTEADIQNRLEGIVRDNKYSDMLQEAIITRRENRFVVPVKKQYRNTFKGIVHDTSASGMTVFMEPMAVLELNNELRELRRDEEAEIKRILRELTGLIAADSRRIKGNYRMLIKFDEIFARAGYLLKNDCVIPEINRAGYVNIKEGRHPLLGEEAVPIDIYAGDRFRLLLITGPNTGGKTVALKTFGLFVIMALSGVPLPAEEGSRISVFNNVFADIGDEQSIEQNLSTFSSHMNNIREYLSRADDESLVLLDEIGAGTDPEEGAALGIAVLEEFKSRNTVTVATTHYSQLKSYAYSTEGVENAAVEFDLETLSPTYRLIMGIPGGSNAFEIALRLGLPEEIIAEARELQDQDKLAVEDIIEELNQERRKYENLNLELEKRRARLERREEKLSRREEELAEKKEKVIRDAREQAERELRQIRARSKKILSELKNRDFTARPEVDRLESEINLEIKDMESRFASSDAENGGDSSEDEREADYDFQPGDRVRIRSLNQQGEIIELMEESGQAEVQAGIMKVTADLTDLIPAEDREEEKERKVRQYRVKKSGRVSHSLDLRGKRYESARQELDKYLDDALLAGLRELEIIHGKGSGVLREAVRDLLEEHPHVKDFREGREEEGGSGVTIVTIGA